MESELKLEDLKQLPSNTVIRRVLPRNDGSREVELGTELRGDAG